MRMGIGLGIGINRSNYAQGIFNAYQSRVIADGGVTEAGACVDAVSGLLLTASLLLIPSGYKSGKAYAQIPTNGNGDLTWTRASTALRTNSSGLLESMATGVPRLSYMYGSCPALLLEPQRTNLALQSQDFDNSSWTKQDVTVTANSTTSPDGTTNADTIVASSTTSNHDVNQLFSVTLGVNYTISAYFKKGTTRYVYINGQTTGASGLVIFDFDTETITQQTTYVGNFSSVGSGWYRVTATFTATATAAVRIRFGLTSSSLLPNSTLTTSDDIFLWGAQLEAGAYPTTYIPTTTASATRIADTASKTGISSLIGQSSGTLYAEINYERLITDFGVCALMLINTDGNFQNRIQLGIDQTHKLNAVFTNNSIGQTVTASLTNVTSGIHKLCLKYTTSECKLFLDGALVQTMNLTVFPVSTLQVVKVGNNFSNATPINDGIKTIAIYTNALSDTDCTTLTTL